MSHVNSTRCSILLLAIRRGRVSRQDGGRQRRCGQERRRSAITALNAEFTKIGRRVLEAHGLNEFAKTYHNPDNNPDIPFLWRSMEWAKDGGVIALAMPARLFGRTTGKGFEAWRAILRSVQVTGLMNGADLRWSSVWKDVKMPFCLFFARNAMPMSGHRFQYACPINEPDLNSEGRFRIDYEAAQPVARRGSRNNHGCLRRCHSGPGLMWK